MRRWRDVLEWLVILLWFTLALTLFTARWAHAQNMIISTPARRVLLAGFDTSSVERLFCVYWHAINDTTVSLDSAYVPPQLADSLHVFDRKTIRYATNGDAVVRVSKAECPPRLATAHWHLLDKNAVPYRSDVDSTALVEKGNLFGVVIVRRHFGDRFPANWIYYDR